VRRGVWLALVLLGCGSPPPAAYTREADRAGAAKRQGDYRAAAEHYLRAAGLADKPRDAEEARYLAADSYARAGDAERAAALYQTLAGQGPDAERRARADFALADLLEQCGQASQAAEQRAAAIRRHPDSGLARSALNRHLRYLRERGGSAAVLSYLQTEEAALGESELGEALSYQRARELTSAGRTTEARDAYIACATRYPYPRGAYWDDALFRAASADLELGEPERAIAHLREMLSKQESATFTGSYERGRYAEAQQKIAEIYRDQLHDAARARAELRRVWQDHPTSTLADDALFQEALLAHAAADEAGTCAPLDILTRKLKDSRYAACAHLLCSSIAPTSAPCHDYIKRAAGLP